MIRKAKLVDNNHEKTSSESEDEDIQKFTASFMQSVADPKERGRTKQKAKDSDEQSSDNETFAAENAQYDTDSTSDVDSSSEDEEEEQDTKRNSKSYGTEKKKIKEHTKSDRIEQDEETSDADSSDGEGGADSSDGEGDADSNDGEGDEVVLPSSSRTNEKVGEDEEEHDEEEEEAESEGEENNIEDGVVKLADMPFAEVQKLKEKIGLKAFNEAMYGSGLTDRRGRRVFKRANRHRPMEMSSKIRVSQFREVIQVKKQVRRDPRFDDLSGEFNETIYKHTYSFLGDVRDREKQKLVKEMRKVKDTDRKKEIKALIRRMENQEKQKDRQQERAMERKKKEQELVKQGKRPYFLKKSIEKKLDLAEKYSELKKSGTVEKYLSKKRKKAAAKDRKKLPYQSEPVR
ncbi:Ribosomal RNA processing protein 36-like protein [Lamellibrachia satsuma]|nr:Ribosomal RNA processing protein 36-like protein [Lamellibrachia satsuma]